MPSVVCPSCRSKLKAPAVHIGLKARCPQCHSPILVPATPNPGTPAPQETKPHQPTLPPADADTFETAALDSTAVQIPIKVNESEGEAETTPDTHKPSGIFVRVLAIAIVALAGTFAVWMAVSEALPRSHR